MTTFSHASSETPTVELHLFQCGHGDTLLLRLPGPQWALVDCYLPKSNGRFDKFIAYLDALVYRGLTGSLSRIRTPTTF